MVILNDDKQYYAINVTTKNPFKGSEVIVDVLHRNKYYGIYSLASLNPIKEGSIGQCFKLSLLCDYVTYSMIFKDFKTNKMLLPSSKGDIL